MSAIFPIILHEGHLILTHEGLICLVDTGSPYSCHGSSVISFLGQKHQRNEIQLVDIPRLRQLVGFHDLTTLLGMDIIGRFFTVFDYPARSVTFSGEPIAVARESMTMEVYMGVPIIEVEIEGTSRRMYLDTGSRLSYLTPAATRHRKVEAIEQDFHPAIGRFETPVFRLPGTVAQHGFEANFGSLPASLSGLLSMARTDGILGHEFFSHFKVGIDTINRQAWIDR